MKKLLLFVFISALFFACNKPKEPEFQSIANPKVKKLTKQEVIVEVDVVMNNPNNIEIEMTGLTVDVYVNKAFVGRTEQTHSTLIGANKNFDVPLKFDFSPKKVFSLGNLGGLLKSVSNKKIDVRYAGEVSVKLLGKEISIPFDHEEEMILKKH